jgi:hypothetical protein
MVTGFTVNKLPCNTYPVARFANAAFQDVTHAKLASYLRNINRLALIGERGVASDDKKPTDARQCGDDILGNTIGEIFLLYIAAEIGKGQYRN